MAPIRVTDVHVVRRRARRFEIDGESLLLASAGGLSGLLLARVGRDLLLTYLPVGQTLAAPLDQSVLDMLPIAKGAPRSDAAGVRGLRAA